MSPKIYFALPSVSLRTHSSVSATRASPSSSRTFRPALRLKRERIRVWNESRQDAVAECSRVNHHQDVEHTMDALSRQCRAITSIIPFFQLVSQDSRNVGRYRPRQGHPAKAVPTPTQGALLLQWLTSRVPTARRIETCCYGHIRDFFRNWRCHKLGVAGAPRYRCPSRMYPSCFCTQHTKLTTIPFLPGPPAARNCETAARLGPPHPRSLGEPHTRPAPATCDRRPNFALQSIEDAV